MTTHGFDVYSTVFCYDAAMKIIPIVITFLWAFFTPFWALATEPGQTPDVIQLPEPDDAAAPTQDFKLPAVPDSMEPKDKALYKAAFDGNLAEVQLLVSKGAAVNSADIEKRTPLIMAAYGGHTAVVEFLYDQGADINHRDGEGMTALMHASKRSFNQTAAFLLSNGAEVNVQSRKRRVTALMIAAVADNVGLMSLLLEHGADPNLMDIFGRTAMFLAEKKGNSAAVEMLLNPPKPVGAS